MIAKNLQGGGILRCFPRQQDHCAYTVTVRDSCGRLISYGKTCSDGTYRICVPVSGLYHVKVEGNDGFCPKSACRWACLSPCCCRFLYCTFRREPVVTTAKFTLTDQHYEGLPIEKGEVFLWPAHTKF